MENISEILLIKNGELTLKGLNRGTFEAVLMKNLRPRRQIPSAQGAGHHCY